MKNKILLYLGIYAVIMTALVIIGFRISNKRGNEIARLESNQATLMCDIEEYKAKDGKTAVRLNELELTKSEFEKLCEEQSKTIQNLNIKVKRLEGISTTATEALIEANAKLKDTIVVYQKDSIFVIDTLKKFEWKDAWNSINGEIRGEDVKCAYHGVDTLSIVASKIKKKCLFQKNPGIEINVINSNPSNKITYSRVIKIKK